MRRPDMRGLRWLSCAALALALSCPAARAADSKSLSVSAVVPTKSNCKFNSKSLTLAFGSIDPSSGSNATATSTSLTFSCGGSASLATFSVSTNDGLYASGAGNRRMRHATTLTEFLPYSLSISPQSATVAKNALVTLTITGTVQPFQFANAIAGSFADTVVISVAP